MDASFVDGLGQGVRSNKLNPKRTSKGCSRPKETASTGILTSRSTDTRQHRNSESREAVPGKDVQLQEQLQVEKQQSLSCLGSSSTVGSTDAAEQQLLVGAESYSSQARGNIIEGGGGAAEVVKEVIVRSGKVSFIRSDGLNRNRRETDR
jgi:hypothetical protein